MRGAAAVALCGLALGLWSRSAGAQSAEAEELFHQGRKALEAGDFAVACAKLDASERLERAVGTLMSLSACEEAMGHLAGARQHMQEAADWAFAKNDPLHRGPVAREKFNALDRRVPRLTLTLLPGAPASSRASRDDVDLGTAGFGAPLPVDPGRHTIIVTAPGHRPAAFEADLREGEAKTLTVAPGAAVRGASSEGPAGSGEGATTVRRHQRAAGLAIGALGIVGAGLGAGLGAAAGAKWSDAKRACVPGACGASSEAQADRNRAEAWATASTAWFVASGAALATGLVLVLTSHRSAESSTLARLSPLVGSREGGLVLSGSFR
jgi:hypothetical protein